ncbi:MAG: PHP domain-containing protein [Candidatus Omnitrophica bacterium]|nr:PHP domain-containing protein [Candidatus Omnitrophota bacterium]
MRFADLHLHTFFSDGSYSPSELVQESRKSGLYAISIVDHDNVEGIEPASIISKEYGIEVLSGIELSAEYENAEIHILGYLIDYKNTTLLQELASLRKNRVERIYKITDKLEELGVHIDPKDIFAMSGGGTVGRLHVARAMVKENIVSSVAEAFARFIGDDKPAYVLGFKFSPSEAITLIKQAGGVPVLAHPYTVVKDDMLFKLISQGIMGLEVYYPEHTQSMVNFYRDIADRHGLLITGGSDCHGLAKPEIRIGSVKIPYELVERIKEAKAKI